MKIKYKILLVDDSVEDQLLTQYALKDSATFEIISCLNNGDLAIAYFKGWHEYARRAKHPLPDLLLLDLNMPLPNGFEVLRWLKAHPQPGLVKVMLTSSELDEDIARATALGAHGYVVKPKSLRDMQSLQASLITCMNVCRGTPVSASRRNLRARASKSAKP